MWENQGIRLAEIPRKGPVRAGRLSPAEASAAFPSLVITGDGTVLATWQQRGPDDRWQVRVAALPGRPSPG